MKKVFKFFLEKILTVFGYGLTKKSIFTVSVLTQNKYYNELSYWINCFNAENKCFRNDHYKKLMLGIANEKNDDFMKDRIVADFGCGPRGSLTWTKVPSLRIGIDVLVDRYFEIFKDEMINDDMLYIKSTENYIPIPTNFVDIIYTMGVLSRVDNFNQTVSELFRILKTGGEFIADLHINEPITASNPKKLTLKQVENTIIKHLDIKYKVAALPAKFSSSDLTSSAANFFSSRADKINFESDFYLLWIRGIKK
jgi:SAM-dependent methyltransferase